jgi:LacI family transcriptional regulator
MGNRVTLQDIANNFNVTKVSVSKAINNQPGISQELREKILAYAYESGYKKASRKNDVTANTFAFVVQKNFFLDNEDFYTVIFRKLNSLCQNKGQKLFLFVVNPDDQKDETLNQLNKNIVNGIFIGGEISGRILYTLNNVGIPMVYIDFRDHHIPKDCIIIDNYGSGYEVTNYLIDRGHRRVGFINNDLFTSNVFDRFYGYRKALLTNNLEYREEWTINNFNRQTGYYMLDYQLPKELPTAFVCQCDMAAYFFIQKLNSIGKRVPEDISVISFDNTNLAQTCTPPLTSVNISKDEFAIKAMKLMNTRINNLSDDIRQEYIDTRIVTRKSVLELKS